MQLPLQLVSPLWQLTAHAPLLHFEPAGHTFGQLPQCWSSLWRFTHTPLQLVSPAWQLKAHAPLEQICPAAHAFPQAPQLALSELRLIRH